MQENANFQDFFVTHTGQVSIEGLIVNIILSALLCAVLGWVYVKYGTSLSNRHSIAKNFVLVGVTTTLVITVVKSSLALSLGLVGALSIVRFRAAIKEPEELGFLFLTIAIGLGFGADQRVVTVIAFALIIAVLLFYRKYYVKHHPHENFVLSMNSKSNTDDFLTTVTGIIEENTAGAVLRRFERNGDVMEAIFIVNIVDLNQLDQVTKALDDVPFIQDYAFVEELRLP